MSNRTYRHRKGCWHHWPGQIDAAKRWPSFATHSDLFGGGWWKKLDSGQQEKKQDGALKTEGEGGVQEFEFELSRPMGLTQFWPDTHCVCVCVSLNRCSESFFSIIFCFTWFWFYLHFLQVWVPARECVCVCVCVFLKRCGGKKFKETCLKPSLYNFNLICTFNFKSHFKQTDKIW